jgi:hypothetical protein
MSEAGWRWREGELSLRDFQNLNAIAKNEYIQQLEMLPTEDVSSTDEIILNRYSKKKPDNPKFFEL